jgi:hypothetical protein
MPSASPGSSRPNDPACYHIWILGRLDSRWSTEFPHMEITVIKSDRGSLLTHLTGVIADQAELHGLLHQIRDNGLTLVGLIQADQAAGLIFSVLSSSGRDL